MKSPPHAPSREDQTSLPIRTPCYDARHLIPDGQTAQIMLDGQVYTLRITRADKLILTK